MLSFATEFPVLETQTVESFFEVARLWLLGSRYTKFTAESLPQIQSAGQQEFKVDSEKIEILSTSTSENVSSGFKYTKTDNRYSWITTIIFATQDKKPWVSVRVVCESLKPAFEVPKAKKPVLIQQLLEYLQGGNDGLIKVSALPITLTDSDISLVKSCMDGNVSENVYLPIVYVSITYYKKYLVNCNRLAKKLAGMAHVFVEPNISFSQKLKYEVNKQNVYSGNIGIYFPNRMGKRSFFWNSNTQTEEEIENAIYDELSIALCNRRPKTTLTWNSVFENHLRLEHEKIKSGSEDTYAQYFDDEMKIKDNKIIDAEKEIIRLKIEISKLESQIPIGGGLQIDTGDEDEFYAGEFSCVVHDALVAYQNSMPSEKQYRRLHIIKSLCSAYKVIDTRENNRKKFVQYLKITLQ